MGIASSFLPSISDFDSFKDRAEGIGLQALQCTPYHWQLRGGSGIVNYYPTKGTIHVNGTQKKVFGSAEEALTLARKSRTAEPSATKRVVPADPRKDEYSEYTEDILSLIDKGYRVDVISQSQYRINGQLDIYPKSMKYHILRGGFRGEICDSIENFVIKALGARKQFSAPNYRPASKITLTPKPVLKRQYSDIPSPRVGTAW